MMSTTLVAILSMLQTNCCAVLSEIRAEREVFSPLALSQRNKRRPKALPSQTSPGGDWQGRGGGEAASQRADNAALSSTVETWGDVIDAFKWPGGG
jgi:hypothetical protein